VVEVVLSDATQRVNESSEDRQREASMIWRTRMMMMLQASGLRFGGGGKRYGREKEALLYGPVQVLFFPADLAHLTHAFAFESNTLILPLQKGSQCSESFRISSGHKYSSL
jgi:hypothetical protein